mgnify:CR=1 FL=1
MPMPAALAELLREYNRWLDDQPSRTSTGLLLAWFLKDRVLEEWHASGGVGRPRAARH